MNSREIIVSVFAAILTITILYSCVKDQGKLPTATPAPAGVCDSATYDFKIKTIIDSKCKSCHSPSGGPSGAVSLTDYAQVKSSADGGRIKARCLDQNPSAMPPSGNSALTSGEKNLIQCWLDKGSPQ